MAEQLDWQARIPPRRSLLKITARLITGAGLGAALAGLVVLMTSFIVGKQEVGARVWISVGLMAIFVGILVGAVVLELWQHIDESRQNRPTSSDVWDAEWDD